jgi:prevent-host-death family protein
MTKRKIKESECSIMELRRTGADAIARVKLTGERVTITNHGKPQAAIVPLSDLEKLWRDENQAYLAVDEVTQAQAKTSAEFVEMTDKKSGSKSRDLLIVTQSLGKNGKVKQSVRHKNK